ncbi:MAG: hypothetical protein HY665_05280 [Chloroflexi bacterium]|nr:hypothetical protein [Chloroflexota bacterium]
MANQAIRAVVVNDSSIPKCEAACGIDWSLPEAVALARKQIMERVGSKAQLEFVDLARPGAKTREYQEKIKRESLSVPVLLVNGKPRISGEFDIRQLIDAIEAEAEIES